MLPSKFVKNIAGKRFGRLQVISFAYSKNHRSFWNCVCDCNNTVIIKAKYLSIGDTKSCGCLCQETSSKNSKNMHLKSSQSKRNEATYLNGKLHKLYGVWKNMKARCYNSSCRGFRWYGKKGVNVFEKWKNDASCFINWCISNGWKEGLTIDRIDSNGHYEPGNIQFITQSENLKRSHKNKKK